MHQRHCKMATWWQYAEVKASMPNDITLMAGKASNGRGKPRGGTKTWTGEVVVVSTVGMLQ